MASIVPSSSDGGGYCKACLLDLLANDTKNCVTIASDTKDDINWDMLIDEKFRLLTLLSIKIGLGIVPPVGLDHVPIYVM